MESPPSTMSGGGTFSERMQQFKYDAQQSHSDLRSPRLAMIKHPPTASLPSPTPLKRSRSNSTSSPNAKRRAPKSNEKPHRKTSSKYAAPSQYAHLSPLDDVLQHNLLLVFVGVNPGISTAQAGHAYAHPSNRFWHLLYVSGLTSRKHSPTEDRDLPRLYRYGNTNIVSRPTKDQAELSKEEMVQGTADLESKFRTYKPEAVCIVGKGIWEAIWKYKHGRGITKDEFKYGWQEESENMGCTPGEIDSFGKPWQGSRIFVATSTSGLAAAMKPAEKEAMWKILGDSIAQRRREVSPSFSVQPAPRLE